MAKVLVVDDEQGYRDYIRRSLSLAGHEVYGVESGAEAVAVGSRLRPDVLIADWMLRGQMHGLHVSRVIRAVHPSTATILITGFPTPELRHQADEAQVAEFIEKPFGLNDIEAAVERVLQHPPQAPAAPLAVIEVDHHGTVVYANPRAREMFARTRAGREASSLADLFGPEDAPDLDAAASGWHVASPRARGRINWHVRAQARREGQTRLVVLMLPEDPHHPNQQLVEMLLGVDEPRKTRWPHAGRLLVVEPAELYRRFIASALEAAGASCYAVADCDEARKLLRSDPGIRFALLGHPPGDPGMAPLVEWIARNCPHVRIIANSENAADAAGYAAAGIRDFLLKPWRVSELIRTAAGS